MRVLSANDSWYRYMSKIDMRGFRLTVRTANMCTRALTKTLVVPIGVTTLSALFCLPVHATPADDRCPLAMSVVCRFVPIAPDLDGDVDLSPQVPPAGPRLPAPDLPPADVCARGCA